VHRLTARLRTLRRFGLDLCLGHMVPANGSEPVYVGRLGLTDGSGRRLLLDWRSPAAEPFFGATHANPMGLTSRRRYRWTGGRISDYWDEVFTAEGYDGHAAALDDQSAFIASLGSSRSARMRDVLGTIQADQDAIIRAGSRGALVVDGGPGTGKTVVALHRTPYLLYSEPRLGHRRGGVLLVGPHQPYLAYVGDRAQARHGFGESWQERLARIGLGHVSVASLTINYRTPEEVMAEAEPVIRAVLPDANVPTSIRTGGVPVLHGSVSHLGSILDSWLAEHPDGIACVIGVGEIDDHTIRATPRVRSLTPELAKGLEFDLVVLLDPDTLGAGIEGAVDRYVAMTRATQRLVIHQLVSRPLHAPAWGALLRPARPLPPCWRRTGRAAWVEHV
jgi:hypothetical protein